MTIFSNNCKKINVLLGILQKIMMMVFRSPWSKVSKYSIIKEHISLQYAQLHSSFICANLLENINSGKAQSIELEIKHVILVRQKIFYGVKHPFHAAFLLPW